MKKTAFFPFNNDLITLLRYKKYFSNTFDIIVSSYKEDSFWLNDVCHPYGAEVEFDINKLSSVADSLIILDRPAVNYDKVRKVFSSFRKKGKEVYVSRETALSLKVKGNDYKHVPNNEYGNISNDVRYLYDIDCPIIGIFGMGKNCSKFETLVGLKIAFNKEDLTNIVYLSCNTLGPLFGMYSMPGFLYGNEKTFREKVLCFNRLLYDICINECPDAIVIECPDGLAPLNKYEDNNFSEVANILTSAAPIDLGIITLYFEPTLSAKTLKGLQTSIESKYNIPDMAFVMGRQKIDFDNELKKTNFLFLSDEYIGRYSKQKDNDKHPIFQLKDSEYNINILEKIIDPLKVNIEVI